MKNILKKIVVFLLVLISFATVSQSYVSAGSYYYDQKQGAYIVSVNGSETGKNLNSWPAKVPGSVANQMRNAALKKYGSISNSKRYYFSYKNVVKTSGAKNGVPSSQWNGRVTGMSCTGRK